MNVRRHKVFSIIAVVVLLLAAIAVLGVWQFNRFLQSMNIHQLEYRIAQLGSHHLALDELTFVYMSESTEHRVSLEKGRVHWQSWFAPRLISVDVEQMRWEIVTDQTSASTPSDQALTLPEQWTLPDFFPEQMAIRQLVMTMPCPAGECAWVGQLDIRNNDQGLTLDARINPGEAVHPSQSLHATAAYKVQQDLPQLVATLTADKDVKLELQMHLVDEDRRYWSGSLNAAVSYPDAWLRDALENWNIYLGNEWAESLTELVEIHSEWHLALEPLMEFDPTQWQHALDGRWLLDGKVASPIQIKNRGEFSGKFSGEIAWELVAARGRLQGYQLSASVDAIELLLPEQWRAMGIEIEALSANIQSQMDADPGNAADLSNKKLPLTISAETRGLLQSQFDANVSLNIPEKKITFEKLLLKANAKKLMPTGDLVLDNLRTTLSVEGYWQDNTFNFTVTAPSDLASDIRADSLSLQVRGAHLKTDHLDLHGELLDGAVNWSRLQFDTKASLATAQLQYPPLQPVPWRWQGSIKGTLDNFTMTGDLNADMSLAIQHRLIRKDSVLTGSWQLADVFLLAGNPFADLTTAWPPLLTLAQGKVKAEGKMEFDIEKNSLLKSQSTIQLSDLTGIYDTTAFQGLTTSLLLTTREQTMKFSTDNLRVKQVNKGFVAGPFVTAGFYETHWEQLMKGKFSLQHFTADVMGGTVSTPAQVFDLSQDRQALTLTLDNIDLATLLQQHPSTELSGSGRISGTVPIEISADGVSVPKGVVSAKPPGGQLQYRSARAEAIAKSQPGMKVITDALDDFHYTVLASEVSYDVNGKLLLAVRLEGKNPALEKGRPVHFNINLEEDLPAMIASIQLSNQISDLVKKRLQERLQKRTQ